MSYQDYELYRVLNELVGVLKAQAQGDVPLWRINPYGDIIFGDSFEGNELHWEIIMDSGCTVQREYRPRYVYHGNTSICITLPTTNGVRAGIQKFFPTVNDMSGVGFEYAFMCQTRDPACAIVTQVIYFDGDALHGGAIHYYTSSGEARVSGATEQSFYPQTNLTDYVFQRVKFTVDFESMRFKNLFFNNVVANLSSINLFTFTWVREPCLMFVFLGVNEGTPTAPWSCWVDDFMLTIKEPQL